MTPLLRVDRAGQSLQADGGTMFDDPSSPWLVTVWPGADGIGRLEVDARPDAAPVTAARLARLPTAQMWHALAVQSATPNEAYYRMLAVPRCRGDGGHWARVRAVYEWAVETGRAGGPVRAVADMWGVTRRPTAYRWVAEMHRQTVGSTTNGRPEWDG